MSADIDTKRLIDHIYEWWHIIKHDKDPGANIELLERYLSSSSKTEPALFFAYLRGALEELKEPNAIKP